MVISGIRLPWTTLEVCAALLTDRSAPQTRHLVASSLTRVPQVGQTFVGLEGLSMLILNIECLSPPLLGANVELGLYQPFANRVQRGMVYCAG